MLKNNENPHFKAYYHHNGIVIQFMIMEFIEVCQLVYQINKVTGAYLESDILLKKSPGPLHHFLHQLIGSLGEVDRPFISSWENGPLTKLKNYCGQFSKNAEFECKPGQILFRSLHHMWLNALHIIEAIHTLKNAVYQNSHPAAQASCKRNLILFNKRLEAVKKQFPALLKLFRHDENVMFLLMKKKEELTEIYGPIFADKFFKPGKEEQKILKLLLNRYSQRGFAHLITQLT